MADHARYAIDKRDANYERFVVKVMTGQRTSHLISTALGDVDNTAPPVLARINHNLWIADCECAGAEAVDPGQPEQGFFCFSCYNIIHGGLPRRVVYPKDAVRAKLEQRLLLRPDVLTRNWVPTETVEDLERENVAHGLPSRPGGKE
jgi:hypothetical protein